MSIGFHEISFPSRLAYGAAGGPKTRVDVTQLASGHEKRNARWSQALRRYSVDVGQRPIEEIRALISFFEMRGGPLNGFRFKDPIDNSTASGDGSISSQDVEIGVGDGAKTQFQLKLNSGRIIQKPIGSSVLVSVSGATLGEGFNVDETTGIVSFEQPPAADSAISAGFDFDVPVRFENEELISAVTARNAAQISDISLMEIRL